MRKRHEIATAFSPTQSLNGVTGLYLVGIGGAGMSGLARMLKRRGIPVRGSDSTPSTETARLLAEGIDVFVGASADPIQPTDALVLSDAIDLDTSPEVAKARELGIPLVRRSQLLGWLLKDKKVIAVTGTHGKTTTTAMLGEALVAAGLDPLAVAGARIPQWDGPIREGDGEYAVVEACEAYDSFHDLDPYIVVLTNLELDHVDFHGTYQNLRNSVVRFVDRIPEGGWLVYCSEDRGASEVAELTSAKALPYGASDEWQTLMANKVGGFTEPLRPFPGKSDLALPGHHNLLNAAGALCAAALVKADLDKVELSLRTFKGAERRLEILYDHEILVVDDYAHHPSEIVASLTALRERYFESGSREGRLVVVFQPHLYSRTAALTREFGEALSEADEVVLTDIYPAREAPMPGVSSAVVAESVSKPLVYIPSRHLLPRELVKRVSAGDIVVGMGAGNISEFAPAFVREWSRARALQRGERPVKVAVIYGGESAEREVSLNSGLAVHASLKRQGMDCSLVDVTESLLTGVLPSAFSGPERIDVAVLAVHGTGAEDGAIQGLLELAHIPYTGSGIQSSAIAMDKALAKQVLEANGIRTPQGKLLRNMDESPNLPLPLVVKPNSQGSTVGLSFVSEPSELNPALRRAFTYGSEILVEEWIRGMEISTPVIDELALIPVEIVPESGRYDFASKYKPGATLEIVPARLDPLLLEEAKLIALKAHKILGCRGATRTDAIVIQNANGESEIVVLEINTVPGMTPTSLLPNSAAAAGIDFDQLCKMLVESALGSGPLRVKSEVSAQAT